MKELEKTKRISIAAVLFILVVIIALLSYKRPKHLYAVNTNDTLEKIITNDYFVSLNDINKPNYILIDTRDLFEYEKGHLENAINIPTSDILDENNSVFFDNLKAKNKTAILYGSNPNQANIPFMLLYQLGYKNIKLLNTKISYSENKIVTKNVTIEKGLPNIKTFINKSLNNTSTSATKPEKKAPKKVISIKKKKKRKAEGGC